MEFVGLGLFIEREPLLGEIQAPQLRSKLECLLAVNLKTGQLRNLATLEFCFSGIYTDVLVRPTA